MLSLKYIRENQEFVQKSLDAKRNDTDLNQLLSIDVNRRKIISQVEELKAKRNIVNKDISKKINFNENIEKMRLLSSDIKSFDKELKDLEESRVVDVFCACGENFFQIIFYSNKIDLE